MAQRITRRYISSERMTLHISADFAQASSPIWACWTAPGEVPADDDGRWFSTPYQVADARHYESEAFRLVREWGG